MRKLIGISDKSISGQESKNTFMAVILKIQNANSGISRVQKKLSLYSHKSFDVIIVIIFSLNSMKTMKYKISHILRIIRFREQSIFIIPIKNMIFIERINAILSAYKRLYLSVTSERTKLRPTYNRIKLIENINPSLKNNKVINKGITIPIGESQIKCLKIIIIVRTIGMSKKI